MKPIEVLLVEDNAGDVRLTQEALKESRLLIHLSVVRDGLEAMTFLRSEGDGKDAVTPDLILLDLNLPKKDGRDVLREIKADPELARIPVVVLTSSDADSDIQTAYGYHANCYIAKPVGMEAFIEIVKLFEEFWFTVVSLPSCKAAD